MLRKLSKCNTERNRIGIENCLKFIMKTISCMTSRNKEALADQAAI